MHTIVVCVGSSCYLKGSNQVLDMFTSLVRQYGLESSVTIAGAFCMEQCQHGVAVCIDGTMHSAEDLTAARALFEPLLVAEGEERS